MVLVVIAGILVASAALLWAGVGNDRLQGLLQDGPGGVRAPDGRAPTGTAVGDRQRDLQRGTAADGGGPAQAGRTSTGVTGRARARATGQSVKAPADALAFDLELAAICLGSGLPTEHALALAARAGNSASGLDRLARAVQLGERIADGPLAQVAELIEFSGRTGVALAPLLRGLARDLRRGEHRRRQLAAARLGTQLVIPLGVCILPSFVLLGVVPVLITLVGDFAGVFGT